MITQISLLTYIGNLMIELSFQSESMEPLPNGNKVIPKLKINNGSVKNGLKVIVVMLAVCMKKQQNLY